MFMSVHLPEPDGPMTATNSPALDRQRHAVERAHLDLAHLVDLDEILDPDDVQGSESPASARPAAPAPGGRAAGVGLGGGEADDDRVAVLELAARRPA